MWITLAITSADFLNKLYLKRPKLSTGAWAGNGAQGHMWITLGTPLQLTF